MDDVKAAAEALVPKFKLDRQLNQDQAGRRTALYGAIDGKPAVLILERAPFPSSTSYLAAVPATLAHLRNLGANDIYHWFMASSGDIRDTEEGGHGFFADLKINLIYPCTDAHVKKYSRQRFHFVVETPDVYAAHVRPFIQRQRDAGRLNWVYNVIEGRAEVEDVIYRTPLGAAGDEGFLLTPDLNWDRSTLPALHLLAIVERRDLWSVRDLNKGHVPWLRRMRARLVAATTERYPSIEEDQLKLYVHYQPTYYHFHVHIVHIELEAGTTQAVGKALALDAVVEQLASMAAGDAAGMDAVALSYTLGEASELWAEVFGPLRARRPAPV